MTPVGGGVLVASPSTLLREQVLNSFQQSSCPVQQASGGAEALVKLETGNWQLLYLDRRLPDLDAEELVQIIKRRFPGIRVVVVDSDSAPASGSKSVAADLDRGPLLASSSPPCTEMATDPAPLPGMIGGSQPMQRVYKLARLVARRTTTVLILGDTGTGKELVARGIHELSPRAAKAFVAVNCAAIPETLLESELFGFVRGAFTGAVQAHAGRIHAANGGTLFLDEIGEMPLGIQAKLLRFLEQKEIQRLGGTETARVDARVLAASNADLERKVTAGEFREDLFYRLSVFPIQLPALEQRPADIVPLARSFLAAMAKVMEIPSLELSPGSAQMLQTRRWKGNVRELRHVIERAAILADGSEVILPEHLCFFGEHAEVRAG